MDDNEMNIVVNLQDDASSQLESMVESMDSALGDMADTFSNTAGDASSAISEMQETSSASFNDMVQDLNSLMTEFGQLPESVQSSVLNAGGSFDTMASSIESATEEASAAMDKMAADMAKDAMDVESSASDMSDNVGGSITKMNAGLLLVGGAMGQAAGAINSAISTSISTGDQWNQELAAVQQTLKDTGSSIPLSQVQAFAMQIQATTPYTQEQALAAADLVLKYKDLQGNYQQIVTDGANAAVGLGQTTGSMGDLGNAAKALSDAFENPVNAVSRLMSLGIALPASLQATIKTMAEGSSTSTTMSEKVKLTAEQTAKLTQTITDEKDQLAILNEEQSKSTGLTNSMASSTSSLSTKIAEEKSQLAILTQEHGTTTVSIEKHALSVSNLTAEISKNEALLSSGGVTNLSSKENSAKVATDEHTLAVKKLTDALSANEATLAAGGTMKDKKVKTAIPADTAGADKLLQGALSDQGDIAKKVYDASDATDHLNKSMNDLSTTLGGNLIKNTNAWGNLLAPIVSHLNTWAQKNPNLSSSIVLVAGGMATIISKVAIFLALLPLMIGGLASLGITFTSAFSMVGAVVAGIAVLIAIVAEIIIHWSTVSAFFIKLWDDIKKAFNEFTTYVSTAWDNFWNGVHIFLTTKLQDIQNAIQGVWDWIEQIFDKSKDAVTSAWNNMWKSLGSAVTDAWEGVKEIVKDSINSIIDLINDVINKINSVMSKAAGVLHLSAPQIPDIPLLANGGIVNQATLAIIGEAGPEAVIPLSQMGNLGGNSTQGQNIVININNPSVRNNQDIESLRKMVDKALRPLLVNTKIAHI